MIGVAKDPLQHTSMYERLEEESEDSDGEGGLGNVSRVIIRPPGHSGKAKRGHLCFDAAFETGNLGRADLVGDFEYDLFLRPDTCNPRYRFWFNFTVDNVRQDQRVLFNIVNISRSRNLYSTNLTPLVKSSSRPKWQRIARENLFFYKSVVHQNHNIISFAFTFDKEDDIYQFAVAPPYSYSKLQSYLTFIDVRATSTLYKRSVLCKTIQNRNLDMITIDHVKKSTHKGDHKNFIRTIVILARSHPKDSPTSFVCQAFVEFLISTHPIAKTLRENFVFKIIPMVNPDGVFLGNNNCNLIGQDLNRTWHIATEFSQPTLYAIKEMLKELDNSDCYQIDFVIDLHAHVSFNGSFIYGNTYDDVYRYERHLVFPRLFATTAYDYCSSNTIFNADERKAGSCRRFCCDRLSDTVNAYSIEVSFGGYILKDNKTTAIFTEDGYARLGRNLAKTFLKYYRFINVLPVPMVDEIRLKKSRRSRAQTARRSLHTETELKVRPKTVRASAPISYNDLSIYYDSYSSDDGISPARYSFGEKYIRKSRHHNQIPDQFSMMSIKSSKFNKLQIPTDVQLKTENVQRQTNIEENRTQKLNNGTKPYLSIIDFNQLTRGSLDTAVLSLKQNTRTVT